MKHGFGSFLSTYATGAGAWLMVNGSGIASGSTFVISMNELGSVA